MGARDRLPRMSNELTALVERGIEAISQDDVEAAKSALSAARDAGGAGDGRVMHLAGLVGWLQGNLDEAASNLLQAVEASPANAMIQLDAAEFLFVEGELEEAEAILPRETRLDLYHCHAWERLAPGGWRCSACKGRC